MPTIKIVIRDTKAGVHIASTPSFEQLLKRVRDNGTFSQAEVYALAAHTHIRKMSATAQLKNTAAVVES